jgi:hypothetical protein
MDSNEGTANGIKLHGEVALRKIYAEALTWKSNRYAAWISARKWSISARKLEVCLPS